MGGLDPMNLARSPLGSFSVTPMGIVPLDLPKFLKATQAEQKERDAEQDDIDKLLLPSPKESKKMPVSFLRKPQ